MEKQEFLMEVSEISNGGAANADMKEVAVLLMKDAIKQMAKQGHRLYQINGRLQVNMHGVNVSLPIIAALDYFRDQGFTIADNGNGYWTISW